MTRFRAPGASPRSAAPGLPRGLAGTGPTISITAAASRAAPGGSPGAGAALTTVPGPIRGFAVTAPAGLTSVARPIRASAISAPPTPPTVHDMPPADGPTVPVPPRGLGVRLPDPIPAPRSASTNRHPTRTRATVPPDLPYPRGGSARAAPAPRPTEAPA